MKRTQFLGNNISTYGLEKGYVDYACLASCFDAVLCNRMQDRFECLTLENGTDYDEENGTCVDVFQWYIIDERGAEILKEYTDEIVYYDNDLDIYVWAITHYGTAWAYVLTDIKIDEI